MPTADSTSPPVVTIVISGRAWTRRVASTAPVGPPLPAVGSPTQGLDRYCWSTTVAWQLQVTATDTAGATATDTLKFFVQTP